MQWTIRELEAQEPYALRRAVSADGRTDLPSMQYDLDALPGAFHVGAIGAAGKVVGTSSYFPVTCPWRPDAQPAVQLQCMAVDPTLQRSGAGTAILREAIERLRRNGVILLWANARDNAIPFYERFGFKTIAGTGVTPPTTGRPHHIIELDLGP